MRADLHVHSSASDGVLTPRGIVELAAARRIGAIALTDHDSVEGVPPALAAGEELAVVVVPGVELSSSVDGLDAHVLGYFVDYASPALTETLLGLRRARVERAVTMIEALECAGYDISVDEVLSLAAEGAVGRSHIARALANGGHVESVAEAFRHLIGREGPFFVRKTLPTPVEVVRLIRSWGGLPVLAHPGVGPLDGLVPDLVDAGLAGIEAYHFEHTPELAAHYLTLAREHALLVTGGSDFHGPDSPGPGLGGVAVPEDVLPALLEAAARE